MISILINILYVIQILLFVYVLLGFFPLNPDGVVYQIRRALETLFTPVLNLIRRVVPEMGRIDFSVLILFILINIAQRLLIETAL